MKRPKINEIEAGNGTFKKKDKNDFLPWKPVVKGITSGVDFLTVFWGGGGDFGLVLVHFPHQLKPLSENSNGLHF